MVAPPGSILSVEQFIEKVFWPGTVPSVVREGEGPSAPVPQQVQDASSEAAIPRAFDFSGVGVEMRLDEVVFPEPIVPVIHETVEAGESQLRQEAATPERTTQTPEDPPSPGMELSFAQQVADPPTPVHERPADPFTPILEIPKYPPSATPELQFSNEEGGRITTPPGTPSLVEVLILSHPLSQFSCLASHPLSAAVHG